MASLLPFLLALFKAIPALEQLVRDAIAQRDAQREREATQRLATKDAAVDAAIAAPPKQ